jgi:hypothetical protein
MANLDPTIRAKIATINLKVSHYQNDLPLQPTKKRVNNKSPLTLDNRKL